MTSKTLSASNMLKAKLTVSAAVIALGALFAPSVSAQTCTTQYGGTTTCTASGVTIDKKVYSPIKNTYVDNLSTTDQPFVAGVSEVMYSITVTNNTNQNVSNLTIRDTMPNPVSFVSGPGTYAGNTLTYTIESLNAGKSTTSYILTELKPWETPQACVRNTATVSLPTQANVDTDRAQICITSKAGELPVAGFNDLVLMIPFAATGLAGLGLLRSKRI